MLSSHEKCPVCLKDFHHAKYINKDCPIINQPKFSFVESICNRGIDFTIKTSYPPHTFFQLSSLYNEMLFQKVDFPDKNVWIEINYPLHQTVLVYTPKADIHCVTQPMVIPTPVVQPEKLILNKLIDLDFPMLEKALNKIRVFAPFL